MSEREAAAEWTGAYVLCVCVCVWMCERAWARVHATAALDRGCWQIIIAAGGGHPPRGIRIQAPPRARSTLRVGEYLNKRRNDKRARGDAMGRKMAGGLRKPRCVGCELPGSDRSCNRSQGRATERWCNARRATIKWRCRGRRALTRHSLCDPLLSMRAARRVRSRARSHTRACSLAVYPSALFALARTRTGAILCPTSRGAPSGGSRTASPAAFGGE